MTPNMSYTRSVAAFLLLSLAAACGHALDGGPGVGDDDDDGATTATPAPTETPVGATTPTIVSAAPADGSVDVAINRSISAVFSEEMDPATLTSSEFTLTYGSPAVSVPGTVIYADSTVVFWPSVHLQTGTTYTAAISTGAKSAPGVALAARYEWDFATGSALTPGVPVNLGAAGKYVILSKTGVSTVPASVITGNIGVSPAAATYITGFSLIAHSSNVYSRSAQVTGKIYAANYANPTPSNLTTAVLNMQTAFTDAAGRAAGATGLGAGDIGGLVIPPGVYKWGTGVLIPTDVTLDGSPTDVWIFQIAQNLTVENGVRVNLSGGALPKNIFWQVSGAVNIGTTAHLEGVILTQTAVAMRTGSSINGRLLAQTAVTLDQATVKAPAP